MIYRKNLFSWEQVGRVLLGIGLALLPLAFTSSWGSLLVGGGLFVALTGLVGFCPACYMVGRRAPGRRPKEGELMSGG